MKTLYQLTVMVIGLWGLPHVAAFADAWHLRTHPIPDTTVILMNGAVLKGAYSREYSGLGKITSDDGAETLFRMDSMRSMGHPIPREDSRSSGLSLQLLLPMATWLLLWIALALYPFSRNRLQQPK